jgi:hypothetical protein
MVRLPHLGLLALASASGGVGVGSKVLWAKAGAVAVQGYANPSLGIAILEALNIGMNSSEALEVELSRDNDRELRQVAVLGASSRVATAIDSKIYIVVRGLDGASLWYGVLDTDTWTFSSWFKLDGATTATPALCVDKSSRALCIAIKGLDDMVYINMYTGSLGLLFVSTYLPNFLPIVHAQRNQLIQNQTN